MEREYYTIIRKYYGFPDCMNTDLSKGKEGFAYTFDTEYEAKQCLKEIFANGAWLDDAQYGKIRYYVKNI